MNAIAEEIKQVYERLPKLTTREAENAARRNQEIEEFVHHKIGWKGWPCLGEELLARMLRGATDYLQELGDAGDIIDKKTELEHHYMFIMLLFASGRTDLTANLIVDEKGLGKEDIETLRLQWRNLGFPIETREKLRERLQQ